MDNWSSHCCDSPPASPAPGVEKAPPLLIQICGLSLGFDRLCRRLGLRVGKVAVPMAAILLASPASSL